MLDKPLTPECPDAPRNECRESYQAMTGRAEVQNPDWQKAAADLTQAQAMARHCRHRANELEKQAAVQREAESHWLRQAQALGAVVHG